MNELMDLNNNTLERRNTVLLVLWALIFAKCFLLEYWVLQYAVPVNSAIYVWTLSIFMATAATVVYVSMTLRQQAVGHSFSATGRIGAVILTLMLLAVASEWVLGWAGAQGLMAMLAALLGCAYGAHYLSGRDKRNLYSTAGWWIAAGALATATGALPFLLFSLALVLFSALPGTVKYLKLRRLNRVGRGHTPAHAQG